MGTGVSQAVSLLRQENSQLKERLELLEEENRALQSYIQGISALHEATLTIAASQDNVLKLLDEILYQALVIVNTDHGSILLVDEATEELVFALVHGSLRESLEGYRMPWHRGIAGAAVKTGRPQIVNQTQADPRFSQEVDQVFGIKSDQLLAVPMIRGEKTMGVIELVNKREGQAFVKSDVTLLSLLATFAAISLADLEQRLEAEDRNSQAKD